MQREGGNINLPITAETVTYSTIIGLQLNIPLFEGGAAQSKVREAVATKMRAQAELDSAQADRDLMYQRTTRAMLIGVEHIRILQVSLRSARTNMQAAQGALKIGLKKEVDVQAARHQFQALTHDLYRSCYENMMQWLQLQALADASLADMANGIDAQLTDNMPLVDPVGAIE